MTAETTTLLSDDPLLTSADPVEAARAHVLGAALRDSPGGLVGLELEFHLVDLARPAQRPSWAQVEELMAALPAMPSGGTVTVEPGGQLELSTPPAVGVPAAVAALRSDRAVLKSALSAAGYGTVPVGSDLARPLGRVNPHPRYVAMERHFAALGCGLAGRTMMSATAALQLNVDAGPVSGWTERVARLNDLVPVLAAVSACSPVLAGRSSGWASMRLQAWQAIDPRRTSPVPEGEPSRSWADYALAASVMLLPQGAPVSAPFSFESWLRGRAPVGRPPTTGDLDQHLTTLFPPVRPRGYLEIRCLDAVPDRWWPGLAAATVTLVDDEVASDAAAELVRPVRDRWLAAAQHGLRDAELRAVATACIDVAARRCPEELRGDVEAYAELVARGRTPGDELRERVTTTDPLTVLEEEAHE